MTEEPRTNPNFSAKQRDYLEACSGAPYLTQVQRARKIKVTTQTVSDWKHDDAGFARCVDDALAEGKRVALADLEDRAAKHAPKAVDIAYKLMTDTAVAANVRLTAATYLIDRILGKPKQTQEVSGRNGEPIEHAHRFDLTGFSTDELRALVGRAAVRDGDGDSTP